MLLQHRPRPTLDWKTADQKAQPQQMPTCSCLVPVASCSTPAAAVVSLKLAAVQPSIRAGGKNQPSAHDTTLLPSAEARGGKLLVPAVLLLSLCHLLNPIASSSSFSLLRPSLSAYLMS
jgi:hypothetical protein